MLKLTFANFLKVYGGTELIGHPLPKFKPGEVYALDEMFDWYKDHPDAWNELVSIWDAGREPEDL